MAGRSKQKSLTSKLSLRLASYVIGHLLVWTNVLWHYHSFQILSVNDEKKFVAGFPHIDIRFEGSRSNSAQPTVPDRSNSDTERVQSRHSQIPRWMEDYFQWHSTEIAKLNASNYADQKFLLLRCLNIDDKCGGASDRLQTIPAILLAAYRMQRILFIKWERPYALEEFLVPPKGGLNWTLPTFLDQTFTYQSRLEIVNEVHLRHAEQSNKQLIQMRFQGADYGADYYNTYKPDGPLFDQVFHDCWERLFEPSPAVAALVIESMSKLGIVPGQYTAVHIRSKYLSERTKSEFLVRNAVNCGSKLSHGEPIFIAADDNRAIEYAMAYGSLKGEVVVGRSDDQPILHLDRGADFLSKNSTEPDEIFPPSAYYGTFVDFYMLAFSRCLSLHRGGFGRWAKLMMQNSSCFTNHGKATCTWAAD